MEDYPYTPPELGRLAFKSMPRRAATAISLRARHRALCIRPALTHRCVTNPGNAPTVAPDPYPFTTPRGPPDPVWYHPRSESPRSSTARSRARAGGQARGRLTRSRDVPGRIPMLSDTRLRHSPPSAGGCGENLVTTEDYPYTPPLEMAGLRSNRPPRTPTRALRASTAASPRRAPHPSSSPSAPGRSDIDRRSSAPAARNASSSLSTV